MDTPATFTTLTPREDRRGSWRRRTHARALRSRLLAITAAGLLLTGSGTALGAAPLALNFQPYGVYYSRETHQPIAIDPLVFQQAAGAVSGPGPQEIFHAAGLQPAFLDAPPSTALYAADGRSLRITLGAWLDARGTASIVPAQSGKWRVAASFAGLTPGGSYSLFAFAADRPGGSPAPLDARGRSNNFTADAHGAGRTTFLIDARLSHPAAIVAVFHSDGLFHTMLLGAPGLTAHYQLIAQRP